MFSSINELVQPTLLVSSLMEISKHDEVRQHPIVIASRVEVAKLYAQQYDSDLLYHSYEHTEAVAEAADRIALMSGFSEGDHEALLVAAWWHDIGMLTCDGNPVGHEKISVLAMTDFLQKEGYPDEKIALATELIMATEFNSEAKTDLQKAIRDADMSGLGMPEYRNRLNSLRKEWDAQGRLKADNKVEWLEQNIAFFEKHKYLTPVGERLFGYQKALNLAILKKRLKKRRKKKRKEKEGSKEIKSAIQSEKSAQMMLKTTLRNNIDLTSIADGKANIMLTINAAIITLGMPLLAAYIPQHPYLALPGGLLLVTCIVTITYATLATRPVKTSGMTDLSQIPTGKTNLFFFGNYYNMGLSEYKDGLKEVMKNQEVLDGSIMNDVYWLGNALGIKFNRLRICYAVFLFGMVISALAFVIAFYYSGPLSEAVQLPSNIIIPAE